jgi:hypothetical protein
MLCRGLLDDFKNLTNGGLVQLIFEEVTMPRFVDPELRAQSERAPA